MAYRTTGHHTGPVPAGSVETGVRATAVLAASAVIAGTGLALARVAVADLSSWSAVTPGVDAVVSTAAAVLGAGVCAWLAAGVMITVVQALTGRLHRPAALPATLRRLVVWLVGVGIAVSAAAPAAATVRDPGIATAGSVAAESFSPVDLGWSPSNDEPARPATAATSPRATPATPDRAAQVPHQAGSVRVVSGDTLWDIAAQTLPKNASDAQITEQWHRWYEANRDVIGSDPDLILPGQVLHPPG